MIGLYRQKYESKFLFLLYNIPITLMNREVVHINDMKVLS